MTRYNPTAATIIANSQNSVVKVASRRSDGAVELRLQRGYVVRRQIWVKVMDGADQRRDPSRRFPGHAHVQGD